MDPGSSLHIEANVNNLAKIRKFVQQATSALGVTQDTINDIILAVEEAAANIIIHGYKNQPGMIKIVVRKESDSIFIRLQDQAPSFDPTQVPPPDLNRPLDERPLGKLGIYMIKQTVDEMIYDILPGGGNQLTLVKTDSNSNHMRRRQ